MRRTLPLLLLALALSVPGCAPPSRGSDPPADAFVDPAASDGARVREVERLARGLSEAGAFSGVVLLGRGDSILYQGAFGLADRDAGVPVEPSTRFGLASITKTFVSVAVAQLVEQGRLSWDDPLGERLPDFPVAAAREQVRLRHLLTHSSGLRDFTGYCRTHRCPEVRSMADLVETAALAQEDELLYAPGSRSSYNNANFILLAAVLERETGRSWFEHVRERILLPAGMVDTDLSEPGRVPERLAVGYDRRDPEDGVRYVGRAPAAEPYTGYPAPYAAAHATAADLFRFAAALHAGRIVRPETVARMFAPAPEAGDWGLGFDVLDAGRGLVGHGGSWTGMSNSLDLLPGSGYTVVILSNQTNGRSPLREAIWAVLPEH